MSPANSEGTGASMPTAEDSAVLLSGADLREPGVDDPQAHVAWQLRVQARACAVMGSPLYAELLACAAADAEDDGPTWEVLAPYSGPGRGGALALRLMAAVHRLVLTDRAPELARHYPSAGGDANKPGAWAAFRALLMAEAETVRGLVALPCQTNEVGRCAALVGGFLDVAATTGLPLRILELGASGGLNLRWDAYRYGGGGATWGPPESPVNLSGHWLEPPSRTDTVVVVIERQGCDPRPVDATSPEGRLTLAVPVWADQEARFQRLRGALEIASRVPAQVDQASLADWLPERLAESTEGAATVVYHSIVEEYLPGDVRQGLHDQVRSAGERATAGAPVAWLRLEPISVLRSHGLTLTTWPGGDERVLATCGAHGTDVRWRP